MTTPELPGGGSHSIPPHEPQQSASTDHGYGVSTATLSPEPKKQNKKSNTVGLIALIAAVLGFIFACVPGALIIGWVLLPIAFILALVSLFAKNKSKWMGITALILSIVGTIVGVIVFFSVVTDSVDEALSGGETTVVEPSDGTAPQDDSDEEREADSDAGTRSNPYPIGSVIENDEWRIVVNSVDLAATDAVLAANEFNEAPAEGSGYILVNYSATFLGDDPNGQMPAMLSIEYVTADGTTVNSFDTMALPPEPIDSTSALYTDGTATGNIVFSVPTATAGKGALAVRPGVISDKVFVAVQ